MAILAGALLLTACRRDQKDNNVTNNSTTEDTGYADDIARMDQSFDEVDGFADQATEMGSLQLKGGANTLSNCATITKDTVGTPDSLIIDFGPTNCLCKDGRYRRGKIIITQTGHYKDSGFIRHFGFENYHVNDNWIYGGKSVVNKGHNSSGHIYYEININGHIVINATKDTASHVSSRIRTFTAGENTTQIADDEYNITGSGTMTKANGKTYAMTITSPLHIAANCNWIESGTVSILPQGATNARVLNYGNGNCDDQATITVNGNTKTIILK